MSSSKPLRVLVCGDVEGNISQLYNRVNSIQKKSGNFDVLLCVGDFFSGNGAEWEAYKTGKETAPISTLILGPCRPELDIYFPGPEGEELCPNITYLGRRGRYIESAGLQIAYLSGIEAPGEHGEAHTFGSQDVSSLVLSVTSDSRYKGVDILVTSQWPKGVDKYASPLEKKTKFDSATIAEVARLLRPRYHFAGMEGTFYERQPYRNHQLHIESLRHVTRFIGLANVANKEKQKYLYAFSITPMSLMEPAELNKQPTDVTECPYSPIIIKGLQLQKEEEGQQFFYDMSSKPEAKKDPKRPHRENLGPVGDAKKPRKPAEPAGSCWFCLGNAEVEKHLVVSVGTVTYLALAKGGLVPDHVLILPIHHYQSTVAAPPDILLEIEKYKTSLRKHFKASGKAVVFFERNYKTHHLQIQAVPVPYDSAPDVKDTFMHCAENEGLELHEIPKHSDLKQIVPAGAPYFYAELPAGDRLLHRIGKKFPLQFGREVLGEPAILNMPERVDWKSCEASREEEESMAAAFKTNFKSSDFNFSE